MREPIDYWLEQAELWKAQERADEALKRATPDEFRAAMQAIDRRMIELANAGVFPALDRNTITGQIEFANDRRRTPRRS